LFVATREYISRYRKLKETNIPAEMIVKFFEKCGISNALDGSENGSIRAEGNED